MKSLIAILMLGLVGFASAQSNQVIRKVYVRHADPQLIALLLLGNSNFLLPPEITLGNPPSGGGFSSGWGGTSTGWNGGRGR